MKKNFLISIIIILLALALVLYSFDKKSPDYNLDNSLFASQNVITHTIEIRVNEFSPSWLSIHAGEKVIWINKDNSPHTVTSQDKELNSAIIPPNETYYHIFENEGRFTYTCSLRPVLSGEIKVGPER
jgi:plastocyanin